MDRENRLPQPVPPSMPNGKSITPGNFTSHYLHSIVPQLDALETERKRIVRRIWFSLALIFPSGLAPIWFLWQLGDRKGASGMIISLLSALTFIAAIAVVSLLRTPFEKKFNASVVRPLIAFFDSSLRYYVDGRVPIEVFTRSQMFSGAPPDRYTGKHFIAGTLGKTRMCFSEIKAERIERNPLKNIGRRSSNYVEIFNGVFFSADFNKFFSGVTVVLPDRAEKLLGSVGQMLQSWETDFGQLVKLEDPEFERAFVVYSSNQIEARYILTPALMQRILDFRQRSQQSFRISFAGSSVNVAVCMGKPMFQPNLYRTLLDRRLYEDFWNDLTLLAGIVEELNLNTRIWTKS